ncbi:hypothetical protein [Citrobacter rodentium]|uniref:Uncharacterized protein n=1 Tax=Citrobacter rodentium TaxID=67825 RepID=A0A482PRG3_CITRO|nr:hypothetical protein [Citrobacter rodentium]QBY30210.1 hypothetical protein E2R62_16075 [Citrobacter rodentium]UHO32415.1 hypothetical protein K7R23_07040 [Citrobacter rodentium NBRC 105723 = DSM 16636]HAT8015682.1 hypothetical protein [Citrobacter rodentium NBRC 105723 = DSM 16636]HAT8020503.1 hypothetical protein [Citrobacter rodentium]HAT8030410.1 hypothetical protein [Citrobacter rodentium]
MKAVLLSQKLKVEKRPGIICNILNCGFILQKMLFPDLDLLAFSAAMTRVLNSGKYFPGIMQINDNAFGFGFFPRFSSVDSSFK